MTVEQQRIEEIREMWFKKHKAHLDVVEMHGQTTYSILWKEPRTIVGLMHFIIRAGVVYIRGDYGDAILQWHGCDAQTHHPLFFKKLNLDYFCSKYQASEWGRDIWDTDTEQMRVDLANERAELCENLEDAQDGGFSDEIDDADVVLRLFDEHRSDMIGSAFDRGAWRNYVDQNYTLMTDIFGDDCWEFVYALGQVRPHRAISHWLGLKLAVEALENKGAFDA